MLDDEHGFQTPLGGLGEGPGGVGAGGVGEGGDGAGEPVQTAVIVSMKACGAPTSKADAV